MRMVDKRAGKAGLLARVLVWINWIPTSSPQQQSFHVLIWAAQFVLVWYAAQGRFYPPWALVLAAAAWAWFGGLLFWLRRRARAKYGSGDHVFIHSYYGFPEAYLNAFPLLCAVLFVALDRAQLDRAQLDAALSAGQPAAAPRILPADPMRAFGGLFACVYSVTSMLAGGSHTLFYDWFRSSGLELARRRGWGARGYDVYGVLPQVCIPRLSTHAFVALSFAMTWNFWLAWLELPWLLPAAAHYLLGFFIVLLRKAMLFAEGTAGMHKPVLLPAACWYLACSPQLWAWGGAPAGGVGEEGAVAGAAWPGTFLKAHILSMYLMAGVGKVLMTWFQAGKLNWADGTNMQYFLFVSMFARPGAEQCALPRLGWLIRRPWACKLLGWGGLVFEIGSPVALLGGRWSLLVFAVGVQLHYGIFYLQGIDFTGQWVPVLLIFLVDTRAAAFLPAAGWDAPAGELVLWLLGAAHLAGQLFCAFTLREVWAKDGSGGMPFSCMHMFTVNCNIFGGDMNSWFTLQSGDQRATGHLGITEWSGPVWTGFNMSQEDLLRLPFKVVWFGHTKNAHTFMEGAVTAEFQQKRFVLFSNFDVGPDLKKALQEVCRLVDPLDSDPNSTRDASMLDALLAAQRRASDAFFADIKRVALAKVVLKRGVSFLSENMDVARILKLEREVAGGYNDDNESAKLK